MQIKQLNTKSNKGNTSFSDQLTMLVTRNCPKGEITCNFLIEILL